MLKLAATVANYTVSFEHEMSMECDDGIYYTHDRGFPDSKRHGSCWWNPLLDDGDAFRLAIQLSMQVEYLDFTGNARARARKFGAIEPDWSVEYCMSPDLKIKDEARAARRAIVKAAADLCKLINLSLIHI